MNNSYQATVVCWHCQRSNVQLHNVRSAELHRRTGKQLKTNDYICIDCLKQGYRTPDKTDTSRKYDLRFDAKALKKMRKEAEAQAKEAQS